MNKSQQQQLTNSLDAQITECDSLTQLTHPLYKHFGINHFNISILYESGEWFCLCNDKTLWRDFIEERIAEQSYGFTPANWLKVYPHCGNFILDAEPKLDRKITSAYKRMLAENGYHHQFLMINKIETQHGRALRFCRYFAPDLHETSNRFYLNQLELLQRFNRHITQTLDTVAPSMPLVAPINKESALVYQHFKRFSATPYNPKRFVIDTGMHHPRYNQLSGIQLSPRQQDIIHWLLLGKTEAETAMLLNLSLGTINTHFRALKRKFECYSKSQLLLKLIDAEFIQSEDWKNIYHSTQSI